jgi:D-alanine-D-alanine ligase
MRVGVIFGGRSVEHLVSLRSAKTVCEGLAAAGHDVVPLYADEGGCFVAPADGAAVLKDQAPRVVGGKPGAHLHHLTDADVDVVFPIVHGTFGEDGTLQGLLEMLDVPYVGCGTAASAVAMDKVLSKHVFAAAGLPVVPWTAISRGAMRARGLADVAAFVDAETFPLFVKPAVGGSSVGCVKVKTRADLDDAVAFALRFDNTALIERGVVAREVELAVLGADAASMEASVPGEIVPGGDFYDYADKYLKDDAKLLAPAPVDADVVGKLKAAAIAAMGAIGGAGLARVDFFLLPDNSFYLNEINTLPGFTSVSMYPRLWGLSGVPLPELCDRLVRLAVARHDDVKRTDAALKGFVAEQMALRA